MNNLEPVNHIDRYQVREDRYFPKVVFTTDDAEEALEFFRKHKSGFTKCIWDTKELNVAFLDGAYQTSLLLK